MHTLLDYQRRDRWELNHLMVQRSWILVLQQRTAAAAVLGGAPPLRQRLYRQQLRASVGMARLNASLAATAFAKLGRLKPRAIAGGRFGGIAVAAADPLSQVGQFGSQSGELG